jgi:hypothetical protein
MKSKPISFSCQVTIVLRRTKAPKSDSYGYVFFRRMAKSFGICAHSANEFMGAQVWYRMMVLLKRWQLSSLNTIFLGFIIGNAGATWKSNCIQAFHGLNVFFGIIDENGRKKNCPIFCSKVLKEYDTNFQHLSPVSQISKHNFVETL